MSDSYGVRLNAEIARETRGMIARDSLLHDGKPSLSGIYAQRLARVYPGLRAEKCPDGNHWHIDAVADLQADAIDAPGPEELEAMRE